MKSMFRSIQRFTSVFVVLLGCYIGWNANLWFDMASNIVSQNIEPEVPPIRLKQALENPNHKNNGKRWPQARSASLIETQEEKPAEIQVIDTSENESVIDTELATQMKKNRNIKSEIGKLATQETLSFEDIVSLNEIAHDDEVHLKSRARALRILHSHISASEWTEISNDIDPNLLESMENSNSILAEDLLDEN